MSTGGQNIPEPRVSVVMPAYNAERYVREAVDSILGQTFSDFELIAIDDGSNDGTGRILAEYADHESRVVFVRNERNIGLSRTLNRGLAIARGAYIARQDADDVSLTERLKTQVALLDARPDVVLVGSTHYRIDPEGRTTGLRSRPASDTAIRWRMLFHNCFSHTSIMLRADVLRTHALTYDETADNEDYELWSRMIEYGQVLNTQEPLVKRRGHGESYGARAYTHQRACGTRTSRANIARLGINLTEDAIRRLRTWCWHDEPAPFESMDEMHQAVRLFQILNAFERHANRDAKVMGSIRRHLVYRTLLAVPARRWLHPHVLVDLWRSGLLSTLLKEDAASVLLHGPQRFLHRRVRREYPDFEGRC